MIAEVGWKFLKILKPSQTEGEGNGKKLSKKKAAEKMMEELKKLPPLSPVEDPPNRVNTKIRRKQQQLQQQQTPVRNFKIPVDAGNDFWNLLRW